LHRNLDGFQNGADHARIHGLARKSAVEIDNMQPFEAERFEGARLPYRVAIEYRRASHVAAFEPHRFAVLEIDGRKENHGAITASTARNSPTMRDRAFGFFPGGIACLPNCRA